MKVILLDYVYKQGVAGEVIDVADGFARNYLIPKRLAVKATPGELKRAAKLREQAATKRAILENKMNELAREIDGVELIFGRRAAVTGKLFGSVTTQEIADSLMEATGVDINRRRISQQPLREVGTHEVPVRLGTEISPVIKVTIVREDELAEFLARRAAGEAEEAAALVEGEEAVTIETGEIAPETLQAAIDAASEEDATFVEELAEVTEAIAEEEAQEQVEEAIAAVEGEDADQPAEEDDDETKAGE